MDESQAVTDLQPFFEALDEHLDGRPMKSGDIYVFTGLNCTVVFEAGEKLIVKVVGCRPSEVFYSMAIFDKDDEE